MTLLSQEARVCVASRGFKIKNSNRDTTSVSNTFIFSLNLFLFLTVTILRQTGIVSRVQQVRKWKYGFDSLLLTLASVKSKLCNPLLWAWVSYESPKKNVGGGPWVKEECVFMTVSPCGDVSKILDPMKSLISESLCRDKKLALPAKRCQWT